MIPSYGIIGAAIEVIVAEGASKILQVVCIKYPEKGLFWGI